MRSSFGTNEGAPRRVAKVRAWSTSAGAGGVAGDEKEPVSGGSPGEHDLGAWLDALEVDEVPAKADEGEASPHAARDAEELTMVLAEVARERQARSTDLPVLLERGAAARVAPPPRRFDARVLAEWLLSGSQQHAVLEAEPAALVAAQLRADALSEELLARLLEGVVAGPFGRDELATRGPSNRGLLALLALQLYVHEVRRRVRRPEPEEGPNSVPEPAVVRDARLLEKLAVPHEGARPLGERRPRGRPRR